jgi:hypothetical protein
MCTALEITVMHIIKENSYYSGADSDGQFVVKQIAFHKIPAPPSIPSLLNGSLVSLGISQRLEYLQRQIDTTVLHYKSQNFLGYRYAIESALISMKRVVDDLVMSSYCILYEKDVTQNRILKVDGYGALFKNGKPTVIGKNLLETFIEPIDCFPKTLSEVVNSQKHSYLLPESQMMWGIDFPTVVAIYAHRNDYSGHIIYHNHSLGQFLMGFNSFVLQVIERQTNWQSSQTNNSN